MPENKTLIFLNTINHLMSITNYKYKPNVASKLLLYLLYCENKLNYASEQYFSIKMYEHRSS